MKEVQKAIKEGESERGKGRSSLSAIPPPKIEQIYNNAAQQKSNNEMESYAKVEDENEKIRNELCNAYKFLVNYGHFEPNFEWLPMEVSKSPNLFSYNVSFSH